MRSTEERLAAVERRASALKRQQKLRYHRAIGLSATAAALALVVGAGLAMPGIMARMDTPEHLGVGTMASVFSEGSGMGYVMIALLAFTLGVCVTLLCRHLRDAGKNTGPHEEKEDEADD